MRNYLHFSLPSRLEATRNLYAMGILLGLILATGLVGCGGDTATNYACSTTPYSIT